LEAPQLTGKGRSGIAAPRVTGAVHDVRHVGIVPTTVEAAVGGEEAERVVAGGRVAIGAHEVGRRRGTIEARGLVGAPRAALEMDHVASVAIAEAGAPIECRRRAIVTHGIRVRAQKHLGHGGRWQRLCQNHRTHEREA